MTGAARIQQNGIWSNALQFIVPTGGLFGSGNEITMVPNQVSVLVGETRTIQALNSSGAPVSGLVWASSDTTVVSLSTDDPPILTAIAPGHVSVTAGDASAEVTVFAGSSLPTGTVIWSAAGDGSGVSRILPAVPSPTGVADVFALQKSGNVEAITSDGSVAWTANIGNYQSFFCPDFQGGLVALTSNNTVVRFDGMTGQANTLLSLDPLAFVLVEGVHTDGTIFVLQEPPDGTSAALVGLDPATGPKFTVPLDYSSVTYTDNCRGSGTQSFESSPLEGAFVIAGDGNAYFLYEYGTESITYEGSQYPGACNSTSSASSHLRLLRISPNGSTQKTVIGDWSEVYAETITKQGYQTTISGGPLPFPTGSLVTNGDSGVTLALTISRDPYCPQFYPQYPSYGCTPEIVPAQVVHRLLTISRGGIESDVNLNSTPPDSEPYPILQAADGTYFGKGMTSPNSMDAFDLSGNVKWSVPGFFPVMATADGGVIAESSTGQYVTFDQNGVANGMMAQLPTQSWIGNAYQVGSIDRVAATPINFAASFLAMLGANNSANGTAVQQNWFPPLPSCPGASTPCAKEAMEGALRALRLLAGGSCPACAPYVFNKVGGNQKNFYQYLSRPAGIWDGTRSKAPVNFLCGRAGGVGGFVNWLFCKIPFDGTVSAYMASTHADAVSQTPSDNGKGIAVFFDPAAVCKTTASSPEGILNQADLFHEALHGYTGQYDLALEIAFGIDTSLPSIHISYYLEDNVLGGGASTCGN